LITVHAEEMCQNLVSSKGRFTSFQLQNTGMPARSCSLQAIPVLQISTAGSGKG